MRKDFVRKIGKMVLVSQCFSLSADSSCCVGCIALPTELLNSVGRWVVLYSQQNICFSSSLIECRSYVTNIFLLTLMPHILRWQIYTGILSVSIY